MSLLLGMVGTSASAGGNKLVTPGVAALVLALFAPTVITPVVATPGAATLSITAFAPTVAVNTTVTPGTIALTLAPKAPTVATPVTATPGVVALTIAPQTPTVSATANVVVAPGTASLICSLFAPDVSVGGDGGSAIPHNPIAITSAIDIAFTRF